jgi:hypothetical protein
MLARGLLAVGMCMLWLPTYSWGTNATQY